MAEKANGSWQSEFSLKNEEGIPYTQTTTYHFNYEENSEEYDGTFIQTNKVLQQFQEDGIEVKATIIDKIKGRWEVIFGDLYLTYKLSSLEVTVTDVEYKILKSADMYTQFGIIEHELTRAFTGRTSIKKELTEEIQRKSYEHLYIQYLNNNIEEKPFIDLKIKNDTLSFETIDEGTVRFVRIHKKANNRRKYNK